MGLRLDCEPIVCGIVGEYKVVKKTRQNMESSTRFPNAQGSRFWPHEEYALAELVSMD